MVGYSKAPNHPTLASYLSFSGNATSYRYATLDMGEWLALTRQELSPGNKCQASFAWGTHATLAGNSGLIEIRIGKAWKREKNPVPQKP